MNLTPARSYLEKLLKHALEAGAQDAEAHYETNESQSLKFRSHLVTHTEQYETTAVSLKVYIGGKSASSSGSLLEPKDLQSFAERTVEAAKVVPVDRFAGLPEGNLFAKGADRHDTLNYHPFTFSNEDLERFARETEAQALAGGGLHPGAKLLPSEGTQVSCHTTISCQLNTLGFFGSKKRTQYGLSSSILAESSTGKREEGFGYIRGSTPYSLETGLRAAKEAVEEAVSALDPKTPPTQKTTLILTPQAASELLSIFVTMNSGKRLITGDSMLKDALGQRIFGPFVEMTELPRIPDQIGSALFDRDGLPTEEKTILYNGRLENHFLSYYSARQLKLRPRGNGGGITTLRIRDKRHADVTLQDLIQATSKGILVRSFIGSGANLLTGDFSQGARGAFIENGKLQGAADGFTVSGNLKDMFSKMLIASDVDPRERILCGAVMIRGVQIAGV